MTYIEKRLEEFDFRDVDRAIMDFQIHVRKVTGGNDSSCVDSTELKTAIIKTIQQFIEEERERVTGILSAENYKLEEWYASSERPDTLTHFEANQRNMKTRNEIQVLLSSLDNLPDKE